MKKKKQNTKVDSASALFLKHLTKDVYTEPEVTKIKSGFEKTDSVIY